MLDVCIQLPPYEVELRADIDHQLSVVLSKLEIEPAVPAVMLLMNSFSKIHLSLVLILTKS